MRIEDPRYAGYVDLAAATATGTAPTAFVDRLRAVIDGPELPAAAELTAWAANQLPEYIGEIDAFCADIIAATERCPAPTRVVTLVPLAAAGRFDTAELLMEILRLAESPWERLERYEALMKLFPVLIDRAPRLALRELYAATGHGAARERRRDPRRDARHRRRVDELQSAVERGLACTSLGTPAPPILDGVRTARETDRPHQAPSAND